MDPFPSVIGRYQVRERLGHGGMGVLYLALDPSIDRLVALKLLRVDDPELRERFQREARLIARLQSPGIVTIYEVGTHNDQPFMAMEYIAGDTLEIMIRRRLPLPLGRKLALMMELCDALAVAHRAGIVHRDIKPSNIIVQRDSGLLKVLDFGIARTVDSSLTQVGAILGTPNYISPEQVEGRPVDHRSDIFAVGVSGYELLTYRQAFGGDSPFLVLQQIVHGTPTPLLDLDPTLDPGLQAIVDKAMAKDPASRYADIDMMRADLQQVLRRAEEDAQQRTLVIATPTLSPPPPSSAPRPRSGTDLARLLEQRVAQINERLREAEAALERGDPEGGLAAAEQAALIDPHEPRVTGMLDRARAASDRAYELASLVERARLHAESSLAAGDLDGARRAAAEALGYDPASEAAQRIRQQVETAIDDRARETVARAEEEARGGDFTGALARLEAFRPAHDIVDQGLETMRQAIAERQRQAEEAARRAAEIATSLDLAREALSRGDLDAAEAAVAEARRLDETHAGATALGREVDAALAASRRRARRIGRAVARADAAIQAGALDAAMAEVEELSALGLEHPGALLPGPSDLAVAALRERVVEAVESHADETLANLQRGRITRPPQAVLLLLERLVGDRPEFEAKLVELRDALAALTPPPLPLVEASAERATAPLTAEHNERVGTEPVGIPAKRETAPLATAETPHDAGSDAGLSGHAPSVPAEVVAPGVGVRASRDDSRTVALGGSPHVVPVEEADGATLFIDRPVAAEHAREPALASVASSASDEASPAEESDADGAPWWRRRTAGFAAAAMVMVGLLTLLLVQWAEPPIDARVVQDSLQRDQEARAGAAGGARAAREVARGAAAAMAGAPGDPAVTPVSETTVWETIDRVRSLLEGRHDEQALDVMSQALATSGQDARIQALLAETVRAAEEDASRARRRAMRAQAPARAISDFERADDAVRRATDLRNGGQSLDAARGFWRAARLFATSGERATLTPPEPGRLPTTQETASIQDALNRWATAYGTLDAKKVSAIWQMSPDEELKLDESFKAMTRYTVTFQGCQIVVPDAGASANCVMRRAMEFKAAAPQSSSSRVSFQLERRGDRWFITTVRTS